MWKDFKNKFNFGKNAVIQSVQYGDGNINVQNINGGSRVTINGDVKNVQLKLVVDGNVVTLPVGTGILVEVQGNVGELKTDLGDVEVHGNSGKVSTQTGDVSVGGTVTGDVETQTGDIKVSGDVGGSAESQTGDIKAKTINGNCKTNMGDIYKN